MKAIRILNGVIGPVMRKPSSSHTVEIVAVEGWPVRLAVTPSAKALPKLDGDWGFSILAIPNPACATHVCYPWIGAALDAGFWIQGLPKSRGETVRVWLIARSREEEKRSNADSPACRLPTRRFRPGFPGQAPTSC